MTQTKPSFGAKCPNHGEFLEGIPFPHPEKGSGICPVSGASFAYEVEVDQTKVVQDKEGNLTKKIDWKLTGKE